MSILIAWEMGSGLGHVGPLRAIGAELVRRGHRVILAAQNTELCRQAFAGSGVETMPAPALPLSSKRLKLPCTYSDLLHDCGYATPDHQYDAALGLYHMQARWYDPTNGRFISPDPIGYEAGDANLHRYVTNNPIHLVDPLGLEALVVPGSGHHLIPWQWITSDEFAFSKQVQEVWNSEEARIAGKWFNTHDGRSFNATSHADYNKLVEKELRTFFRHERIVPSKMTREQAIRFLERIRSKPVGSLFTKFNAGVRAERDLAEQLGDALYREKRAINPRISTGRIATEVKQEVSDLIKKVASKGSKLQAVLSRLAKGKHLTMRIVKPLAAVGFFWATVQGREVDAAGLRDAVIDLTPLGFSTAGADGLSAFYDYAKEQSKATTTGSQWIRDSTPYDPAKDRARMNYHGINPEGLR